MKKYLCIFLLLPFLFSCAGFVEIESNSVIEADNYKINTEASARYALFGIFEQLQQVADHYVILGELRGDLLTTTDNANQSLRDICRFEAEGDNDWQVEGSLYSIINNCNYLLSRIDTSVVVTNSEGEKERVLRYEMAQAVAIRSWCFMQLALTYGSAFYHTEPLTEAQDSVKAVMKGLDELLPILAADLEPFVPASEEEMESFPGYGTVGSYSTSQLCLPVRLVLADVYLWQNRYEDAARLYYAHLLSNELTVLNQYNAWTSTSFDNVSPKNWVKLFSTSSELQSVIQGTTDYVTGRQHISEMFNLKDDYLLMPSPAAFSLYENQTYAYSATTTCQGDLRGEYGTYTYTSRVVGESEQEVASITKYDNLEQTVLLYRTSTIYLRYAEAINRLGKYNTAFALLKHGLKAETFNTAAYIPASEWKDNAGTAVDYMEFGQTNLVYDGIFSSNVGIHTRGCGTKLPLYRSYAIESGSDSCKYVENLLLDEMGLETAYEGNRFADIVRIARHRADPAAFVAEKISAKYPSSEREAMKAKLSDSDNWYLPHQTFD